MSDAPEMQPAPELPARAPGLAPIVPHHYIHQISTQRYRELFEEINICMTLMMMTKTLQVRHHLHNVLRSLIDELLVTWQEQTAGFRKSPPRHRDAYRLIFQRLNEIPMSIDVSKPTSVRYSFEYLRWFLALAKNGIEQSTGFVMQADLEQRYELEKINAMALGRMQLTQGVTASRKAQVDGFGSRVRSRVPLLNRFSRGSEKR